MPGANVSRAEPIIGVPIDLNGNLTSDGTRTYTWNARNQLTGLSGGASASFVYDGVGRRRGKTVNGTTTTFLYDGPNFVQELSSGGTPTANLLTGLGIGETFTRTDSNGTSTLLTDALGSILELADASGTLQTHFTFEPFGATTASGASSTNAAQFAGRENDGIGLYFCRARYYSPGFQRFISEDPIGFRAGDVNLQTLVGNRPTEFRDPSGLCPWCVIALPSILEALGSAALATGGVLAGGAIGEWIWNHFFNTPAWPSNYPNPANPPGGWTPRPDPRPGEQIWNDPDSNVWRWHAPDARGHDVGHWDIGTPDGDSYRWYPDTPMPDLKKKKSKSDQ